MIISQNPKNQSAQSQKNAKFPPYTNRGGTDSNQHCSPHSVLPPPTPEVPTHIDYLSFTFSLSSMMARGEQLRRETVVDSFFFKRPEEMTIDGAAMEFLAFFSRYIPHFKYFMTSNGKFGYKQSAIIFRDGVRAGLAAFDGNNGTMLVSLSGFGTSGVDMVKLRQFISNLDGIKITRVDIAHDDIDGLVPIEKFVEYYDQGLFTIKGSAPSRLFYDDFGSGEGKSFYVGKKQNGKEACIYEKGKQLGDKLSKWVRSELRLTSVDRYIPLDVLTSPSMYMAGAYPVFSKLCCFAERIQVVKKQAKIAFDSLCSHAAISYGALINVMATIGMTDTQIVQKLKRDKVPRRLILPFVSEQVAA